MRYLKKFESNNFDFDAEEIKDIFDDFHDEGFDVKVKLGKRLHQFQSYVNSDELKDVDTQLEFKPCVWVNLTTDEVDKYDFHLKPEWAQLLNNVKYKLSQNGLYIQSIEKQKNKLTFLIYITENIQNNFN